MRSKIILSFFLVWLPAIFVDCGVAKRGVEQKTILCYYGSWSCYRYGYGKFDVEASN